MRWCPFSCIFIVLVHWNKSLWIDMLSHSDTLSWFRANRSLLFLLNAACLAQKQQIKYQLYGLWFNSHSRRWESRISYLNDSTCQKLLKLWILWTLNNLNILLASHRYNWHYLQEPSLYLAQPNKLMALLWPHFYSLATM